jgi:hypothetical protein
VAGDYYPAPRGAVACRGHELLHWRETLSGGEPIAQILVHYVQRHGFCRSWTYNRRPRVTEAPGKSAPCW